MELLRIAAFLCSFYNLYPNGDTWSSHECRIRAVEFTKAAKKHNLDPYELIAISIHECDLRSNKHLKTVRKGKLTSIDLCPMGLRIVNPGKKKLSRQQIINRSAGLLKEYKRYCRKNGRKHIHKHNPYGHYNWGYRVLTESQYDEKLLLIYSSLKRRKVWRIEDKRTMKIIKYIKMAQNDTTRKI